MPGTDYADRLLNGLPVGDEDWEAHLLRAHEETPGMTPPAFGAYRTREGLSSYEILASALARDAPSCRILDLACGDGFLVQYLLPRMDARSRVWGVDMVPTEIERARRAYPDPRTEFLCERAQRLSLPSASIDLVLSHLALMLMSPIRARDRRAAQGDEACRPARRGDRWAPRRGVARRGDHAAHGSIS